MQCNLSKNLRGRREKCVHFSRPERKRKRGRQTGEWNVQICVSVSYLCDYASTERRRTCNLFLLHFSSIAAKPRVPPFFFQTSTPNRGRGEPFVGANKLGVSRVSWRKGRGGGGSQSKLRQHWECNSNKTKLQTPIPPIRRNTSTISPKTPHWAHCPSHPPRNGSFPSLSHSSSRPLCQAPSRIILLTAPRRPEIFV